MYVSGEPDLGSVEPVANEALQFSTDDSIKDGGLTPVYTGECEDWWLTRVADQYPNIWYTAEDGSVDFAPRGSGNNTSALHIISVPSS